MARRSSVGGMDQNQTLDASANSSLEVTGSDSSQHQQSSSSRRRRRGEAREEPNTVTTGAKDNTVNWDTDTSEAAATTVIRIPNNAVTEQEFLQNHPTMKTLFKYLNQEQKNFMMDKNVDDNGVESRKRKAEEKWQENQAEIKRLQSHVTDVQKQKGFYKE